MIQQKTCILCGAIHEPMFYLKRQMIRGDGSKENIIQGNICADCNEMLEKIEMAVAVGFNNGTDNEHDENLIERYAQVLYMIIKDNPDIFGDKEEQK